LTKRACVIKKAVILAAGLGTRLLPATKEQPKEMLPIFSTGIDGKPCLKPFLQLVFEELHKAGFREFCFVVGRGKRSIQDHFTIDDSFSENLRASNKADLSQELNSFYDRIRDSTIAFAVQPKPLGLGDAVHRAKFFTGNEAFLVHAGDDLVESKTTDHFQRLSKVLEKYNADATFLVKRVENPTKYGVIVGDEVDGGVYRVNSIIEKPSRPPSDIAVLAVYAFNPRIYSAIQNTRPDKCGEVQLTEAIQSLIIRGRRVYAIELEQDEKRIDIGSPESYRDAFLAAWASCGENKNDQHQPSICFPPAY